MYYLNLYLVENDSPGITIGIEQILFTEKSRQSHSSLFGPLDNKSVYDLLIDEMGQEHAVQIEGELKRQVNEHTAISLKDGKATDAVVNYTIPSTLAFQLPFLFALDTFIHRRNYDGIFVSSGPLLNRDDIPDFDSFRKKIDAQEKISGQAFEYFKTLIEKISNSALPNIEKEACCYLRYYRFAQANDISLGECLLAKNQFIINNWDKLPWHIRARSFSLSLNQILSQAKNILTEKEYNKLIDDIAMDAKKALFLPCLDQKADDGGYYNLKYTEFSFIRNMELSLIDGQLVINLSANEGYQEYYAPDKRNHRKFEREMRALAQYNGWELEEGDLHQRMAFSAAYTQKLLQTGIINLPLIQEKPSGILSTLSSFLFFTPSTVDSEDEDELFRNLML